MRPGESARVTLRVVETYLLQEVGECVCVCYPFATCPEGEEYHKGEGAFL